MRSIHPITISVLSLILILCVACAQAVPATPAQPAPNINAAASSADSPTQSNASLPSPATSTPSEMAAAPTRAKKNTPASQKTRQAKGTSTPAAAAESPKPASDPSFNVILGRPTGTSITASLYSTTARQVSFTVTKLTDSSFIETKTVDLLAQAPQNIDFTNLQPDGEYTYIAKSDDQVVGNGTFHTQRPTGSTFTFTIDADPHFGDPNFNGDLYNITLSNALLDQPDFHFDLGDTFMTEKLKSPSFSDAEASFSGMRPYLGVIGASAPLFLVNGNHEGELGWLIGKDPNLPLWCTQLRQEYYPNPLPNTFYSGASTPDPTLGSPRDGYYAFTWGEALFVVLDPFWYTTNKPQPTSLDNNWNWTLGKAQYDWLVATLTGSKSSSKFIFIHNLVGGNNTDGRGGVEAAPYFEWGGMNADGTDGFAQHRPGWGKPIHQILIENHVSAVFHGHDHVFVKQELDGIIYQEVPQPDMAQYNNTSLAGDYGYLSGTVFGSSGHLRVTVAPSGVTVAYVQAYLAKDEKSNQTNQQVKVQYSIPTQR